MLYKMRMCEIFLLLVGTWLTAISYWSPGSWQVCADLLKMTKQDMEKALKQHNVIPDVIDAVPKYPLKVSFESGAEPNFGNTLNDEECEVEPSSWEFKHKQGRHYLLLMVDPDVPSRMDPSKGQYKHFIVGNFIYEKNESSLHYVTMYQRPLPTPHTGFHRYVFLLYKQPGKINFEENDTILSVEEYDDPRRFNFSAKKFAAKYELGAPIACNFFRSINESPLS